MIILRSALIASLAMIGLSSEIQAQQLNKPSVTLDYWWLRDYAKNSCYPRREESACSNVDGTVSEFEARLETQFASNPTCHGVTFVAFGGPNAKPDVANGVVQSAWTLIIDFTPGFAAQDWTLMTHDYKQFLKGSARVEKIASDVCGTVTQRGGNIVH